MRHASRGGAAWGWLGLDRPWLLLGTRRHFGLARWRATRREPGWPCLSPSAPSTSLLQQPPTPTPPRAGPVVSSTPRCPSLTPTRPLAPPPRLVSSRLANRKACRRNNRQSPKQIGRGERRHARGGRGKKAEQRERERGGKGKGKEKKRNPPPAAPPRAAHTVLPPSLRALPDSAKQASQWLGRRNAR